MEGCVFIIAMPKTASTSLMKAIGELNKTTAQQVMTIHQTSFFSQMLSRIGLSDSKKKKRLRNLFPAAAYPCLSLVHSDLSDWQTKKSVKLFNKTFTKGIYKQHFPPTKANKRLLREHKCVFLYTSPSNIIDSYQRLPGKGFNNWRDKLSTSSFREQMTEELEMFRAGWDAEQKLLKVSKEALIEDSVSVLSEIASFTGGALPPNDYKLPTERKYR